MPDRWDGYLNDINGHHVSEASTVDALEAAASGPIEEGSVGGGTGMSCYQLKGGSGTDDRVALLRRPVPGVLGYDHLDLIPWGFLDPFYEAVVQGVEEAVANALVANEDMVGYRGRRTPALPRDRVAAVFESTR